MTVLREHYNISSNWNGKRYLGLDLYWDYYNHKVYLPMLGYVAEALTRFRHKHLRKPQDQTYPHINPKYGVKAQCAEATDEPPLLSKENKLKTQEVTGTLLYYDRAVDITMLTSLVSIVA